MLRHLKEGNGLDGSEIFSTPPHRDSRDHVTRPPAAPRIGATQSRTQLESTRVAGSPRRWPVGSVHLQRTCHSAAVCGPATMTAIRALLYGCLLVACLGLLTMQCYDLVELYKSEPTALIRRMVPAESMSIPGLTVCPNTRLRADVLADWGMLNGSFFDFKRFPDNATMDQLWMAAAVDLDQLVKCIYGVACNSTGAHRGPLPLTHYGHWKPLLSQRGVCYTLRVNRPMDLESYYLGFFHNALHGLPHEEPVVRVFFHGEKAPVVGSGGWMQPGLTLPQPYVTLRPGDLVGIEASADLETSLSLRRRPCHSERRYSLALCRQQCIWRLQTKGCRPPWIPGPAEQSCRTPYELFSAMVSPAVSAARVRRQCHCDISCTREQWTITELKRQERNSYALQHNASHLQIRWAERVRVTTEQLTYGSSSLLSDIGGIIGILFGASIVGLVQMSEGWLKAALAGRRCCRRRRQTAVQAERGRNLEKPLDAWNNVASPDDVKKRGNRAGQLATGDGSGNTAAKQAPELDGMNQKMINIEQLQVV